jgi:murein DD-endopeptidase MepM/ murein hydrolase activator NlpD
MREMNFSVNKEKIILGVVTAVALFCVGIGLASVLSDSKNYENNKNNVVDLDNGTGTSDNGGASEEGLVWIEDDDFDSSEIEDGKPVSNSHAEVAGAGNVSPISEEAGMNGGNTESAAENTTDSGEREVAAGVAVDPMSAYSFNHASVLMWPVNGAIVMNYSMDSTVLHKTLGIYKTSPAVLIGSTVGAEVEAAASGIVQSIYESEETGTTMVIAVGDGYMTTYGLLDNLTVKEGEAVIAGQALGTVGAPTAYYVEEGANVYFAVTKDGEPVDPTEFLATE